MIAATLGVAAVGAWMIYLLGYRHGQADERTRRRARSLYVDTIRMARRSGAR